MKNRATAMVSPEQWGACNPYPGQCWKMLGLNSLEMIKKDF